MHEQSETIERNGKFFNVYGRKTKKAGQPLPKLHEFEKDSYDTQEEAVDAAKRRSKRKGIFPTIILGTRG